MNAEWRGIDDSRVADQSGSGIRRGIGHGGVEEHLPPHRPSCTLPDHLPPPKLQSFLHCPPTFFFHSSLFSLVSFLLFRRVLGRQHWWQGSLRAWGAPTPTSTSAASILVRTVHPRSAFSSISLACILVIEDYMIFFLCVYGINDEFFQLWIMNNELSIYCRWNQGIYRKKYWIFQYIDNE